MKTGSSVRLVQPVIEGVVTARKFNADDVEQLCVEWTDAAGDRQSRWFTREQLVEVPAPESTAQPADEEVKS